MVLNFVIKDNSYTFSADRTELEYILCKLRLKEYYIVFGNAGVEVNFPTSCQ